MIGHRHRPSTSSPPSSLLCLLVPSLFTHSLSLSCVSPSLYILSSLTLVFSLCILFILSYVSPLLSSLLYFSHCTLHFLLCFSIFAVFTLVFLALYSSFSLTFLLLYCLRSCISLPILFILSYVSSSLLSSLSCISLPLFFTLMILPCTLLSSSLLF